MAVNNEMSSKSLNAHRSLGLIHNVDLELVETDYFKCGSIHLEFWIKHYICLYDKSFVCPE